MKISKILLIVIILLAFILRFYKLGNYPALNADEAAIGYNAYSILETGKDEHGNFWPIHFQSFNDYKPGLYFYLVMPFIKIFGLNGWAVRTPNAFLGVATVALIYLLAQELIKKRKKIKDQKRADLEINDNPKDMLPILSAFLLAVSPWHIHFSRGGWEVNTATFFMVLGLLLFLKGLDKNRYLIFSFLSFASSLYTYHSARVVVPLLGLGLVVIYWKIVRNNLKNYFFAGVIMLAILFPLMKDIIKPEIFSRAAGVGLFADPGPISRINEQRGEHIDFTLPYPRIIHNKIVNYSLAFFKNLSDHFHGEFLFLSGDIIQRNRVPETGQMYLFEIVFVLIGLYKIVRSPKSWKIILWWLLIAPAAAALTFQSPHALRAQNMVIPLTLISAYGLAYIINWIRNLEGVSSKLNRKIIRFSCFVLLFAFIFWNISRYLHMYYVHMAKEYPFSSQYGVKELVNYFKENRNNYDNVVVTNKYDQPYILFLFYLKYPPQQFQENHVLTSRDKYGFSTVGFFDKFVFQDINWDKDRILFPNSLIIGTDDEIPKEANITKKIYGSNGYLYFEVVSN